MSKVASFDTVFGVKSGVFKHQCLKRHFSEAGRKFEVQSAAKEVEHLKSDSVRISNKIFYIHLHKMRKQTLIYCEFLR